MTDDERKQLQALIDRSEQAYAEAKPTHNGCYNKLEWEPEEENIFAFVDQLLAAKDARIADLEAKQITPEMLTVWERLKTMKATQTPRYVANNTSDLRGDLWHAFVDMMARIHGGFS